MYILYNGQSLILFVSVVSTHLSAADVSESRGVGGCRMWGFRGEEPVSQVALSVLTAQEEVQTRHLLRCLRGRGRGERKVQRRRCWRGELCCRLGGRINIVKMVWAGFTIILPVLSLTSLIHICYIMTRDESVSQSPPLFVLAIKPLAMALRSRVWVSLLLAPDRGEIWTSSKGYSG